MPTTCCVLGCKSRGKGKDNTVKYFRFPKDEARRMMWIQAIHRENFVPTNNSMVCNAHFTADDYQKRPDLLKLTNKAIPSVFIDSENIKQNVKKKKPILDLDTNSPQKLIKKSYNNLSDHTYVLRLPEPSTSEEIKLEKTADLPTFMVQTMQVKKSIDPSSLMIQTMDIGENFVDKSCALTKLKESPLKNIKNLCQKPCLKVAESNQTHFENSDRRWKEIVFAQSITIKQLRKKVKILQQKIRRYNSKMETLKVNTCIVPRKVSSKQKSS